MADNEVVEVAYATTKRQIILSVNWKQGLLLEQAIQSSDILTLFPEIDLTVNKVGIFAKICQLQQTLRCGDRIEIYRPLIIDPKQARRLRASQPK